MATEPKSTTLSQLTAFLRDERLVPFLNYLLLFFMVMTVGLSGVLALIVANFAEFKAPEWVKSHYRFQARTFWIAIVPVILMTVVYVFIQRHGGGGVAPAVALGLMALCLLYTVGRVITGFNHLFHKRPHPDPDTLLA